MDTAVAFLMKTIRYIRRADIDPAKWDACIDQSPNGLIYAYSNYLDLMAGNWDALVAGDYEAVMPLTWRKKYRIHYLYQPAYTAMLGIFGNNLDAATVKMFLQSIPDKFKYWDIYLNSANPIEGVDSNMRLNYELDLKPVYEEIKAGYRENLKRNIQKANVSGCQLVRDVPVQLVMDLAKMFRKKSDRTSDADQEHFKKLFEIFKSKGMAETYAIYMGADRLYASAVFFKDRRRAYYILVGNHPDGKTAGASHMLIDAFIKDHAGQNVVLDFEGSDIPGLAFFYSSFGAKEVHYPALQKNNLPFFIRWMKS